MSVSVQNAVEIRRKEKNSLQKENNIINKRNKMNERFDRFKSFKLDVLFLEERIKALFEFKKSILFKYFRIPLMFIPYFKNKYKILNNDYDVACINFNKKANSFGLDKYNNFNITYKGKQSSIYKEPKFKKNFLIKFNEFEKNYKEKISTLEKEILKIKESRNSLVSEKNYFMKINSLKGRDLKFKIFNNTLTTNNMTCEQVADLEKLMKKEIIEKYSNTLCSVEDIKKLASDVQNEIVELENKRDLLNLKINSIKTLNKNIENYHNFKKQINKYNEIKLNKIRLNDKEEDSKEIENIKRNFKKVRIFIKKALVKNSLKNLSDLINMIHPLEINTISEINELETKIEKCELILGRALNVQNGLKLTGKEKSDFTLLKKEFKLKEYNLEDTLEDTLINEKIKYFDFK